MTIQLSFDVYHDERSSRISPEDALEEFVEDNLGFGPVKNVAIHPGSKQTSISVQFEDTKLKTGRVYELPEEILTLLKNKKYADDMDADWSYISELPN